MSAEHVVLTSVVVEFLLTCLAQARMSTSAVLVFGSPGIALSGHDRLTTDGAASLLTVTQTVWPKLSGLNSRSETTGGSLRVSCQYYNVSTNPPQQAPPSAPALRHIQLSQ